MASFSPPASPRPPHRLVAAVAEIGRRLFARRHDTQSHVWALLGGIIILTGMAEYFAPTANDKKNSPFSEDSWFTRSIPETARAPIDLRMTALHRDPAALRARIASELDLRAAASAASSKQSWDYVTSEQRARLKGSAGLPLSDAALVVSWSGSDRGSARALDLYHRETLDQPDGLPASIVIGNGTHTEDGIIERAEPPAPGSPITVCLIGREGTATAAQRIAVGEVITALEARIGHLRLDVSSLSQHRALASVREE
jgi:hypothetical protein